MVQMMIVSTNTSKMPKKPCFTGFFVSAQAWAMEPVPRPASLEKMPRDTPFFMLMKKLPTTPPVTEAGLKAPSIIEANTAGTDLIWKMITPSASTIYMIAMKGTSLEVTLPIRLMPPIRIRAMMIARATPMIRLTSFTASAGSTLKLLRAESMAVVIVLTCVALPVPNTASTPKAANKYARKCHFLSSPFLI